MLACAVFLELAIEPFQANLLLIQESQWVEALVPSQCLRQFAYLALNNINDYSQCLLFHKTCTNLKIYVQEFGSKKFIKCGFGFLLGVYLNIL